MPIPSEIRGDHLNHLTPDLLLGAHFSIAGGLHRAIEESDSYGCIVLQMFTKNANSWRERKLSEEDIRKFKDARKSFGIIKIAAHTSYLINIAGGNEKKVALSCDALKQEIIRCGQLGIDYLVLHPGSHMGDGEEIGLMRVAENINQVFNEIKNTIPRLLLETTAGQGDNIGYTFEQLAAVIKKIKDHSRIGVCIDTCHIYAAGYDISSRPGYRKTILALEDAIGLKNLYLIHLNDSKREFGSRIDRHEHIGAGCIGLEAFKWIMNDFRFRHIPKIIETPKGKTKLKDWDRINLNRLRNLEYR
jgi:deoxyribonuclease IV